jgi:hypothetical protein
LLYPTYSVNGIPMQDPQGRWHEHPEMQILPAHPGLRSTSLSVAGVGGELLLPQAPLEPQSFVLHMVVNAIDTSGTMPASQSERLALLHQNTTALMKAMKISRMTQGQGATIERQLSATVSHSTTGHLIASSETERAPYSDYAEIELVFRLPYATWRGELVNQRLADSGTQTITGLAASTAPIDGPMITLAGPFIYMQVTNQFGNGFRYDRELASGEAVTINAENWSATEPYAVTAGAATLTPSSGPYYYSPHLSTVGQTSGAALTLIPEDDGPTLNITGAGRLAGTTFVHVYTTEAFV